MVHFFTLFILIFSSTPTLAIGSKYHLIAGIGYVEISYLRPHNISISETTQYNINKRNTPEEDHSKTEDDSSTSHYINHNYPSEIEPIPISKPVYNIHKEKHKTSPSTSLEKIASSKVTNYLNLSDTTNQVLSHPKKAISIPKEAVFKKRSTPYIYQLDKANFALKIPVNIIAENQYSILIEDNINMDLPVITKGGEKVGYHNYKPEKITSFSH